MIKRALATITDGFGTVRGKPTLTHATFGAITGGLEMITDGFGMTLTEKPLSRPISNAQQVGFSRSSYYTPPVRVANFGRESVTATSRVNLATAQALLIA